MAGIRGLQKATHSVPLQLGVDTKDNPVLVGEGRWTVIENATFTKGPLGQLHTRNGYQSLTKNINGSSTVSSAQALATVNGELDIIAQGSSGFSGLMAYSPTMDVWIERAPITTCIPSISPIVRTNFDQSTPDSATLLGITVYAWADARGGVWFKVLDQSNGTVLQPENQLSATGSNPKLVTQTGVGYLTIVYSDSTGQLFQAPIAVADATTPPFPTAILSSILPSTAFEIVYLATSNVFGLAYFTADNYLAAALLDQTDLSPSSPNVVGTGIATATLSATVAGNGNFVVAAQKFSGLYSVVENQTMYVYFLDPTTNATITTHSHVIDAGPLFTMAPLPSNSAAVQIFMLVPPLPIVNGSGYPLPGPNSPQYIEITEWTQTGGFISILGYFRGCGLVSLPFQIGSTIYLLINFPSEVQQTYFLVTSTGTIVGRFVSLDAGTYPLVQEFVPLTSLETYYPSVQRVTQFTVNAAGDYQAAVTVQAELLSAGGKPVAVTGLDLLELNFATVKTNTLQLGQDLTIAGGLPQLYNSENVNESGFNLHPEAPIATIITSMIGLTSIVDGTDSTPQSFVVTFPINQVVNGEDGALLNNPFYTWFEYITIGATGNAFYFSTANGSTLVRTAPPGLTGYTLNEIPIYPTMSAETIAGLFAASVNSVLSGQYLATVTGNQVSVVAQSNGGYPRPQTYSQFNLAQGPSGDPTVNSVVYANCTLGSLVQPGQYFTLPGNIGDGTALQVYIWFIVNGVGTDPTPPGLLPAGTSGTSNGGFSCSILSTDTESEVATKLAAACNAWTLTGGATPFSGTTANGPIVSIADAYEYAVQGPPTIGTMQNGLGTVGTGVATNQWDSYSYSSMFEAQDAQGQWARSAPSSVTQVLMPAYGVGNFQVQILQQALPLTARPSVDIAIYRTLTLGDLLYRVTSETSLLYNDTTEAYYIRFQDDVPDTIADSNELLYSQPLVPNSVIPNNCPVEFTQAATFQDQLWINDCEDPQLWWYSKSFTTGVQVEFSNEQTLRFDPIYGPTVAAIAMDSNLIMFGTKGIWAINGLGPDSTGAGVPFTVYSIASGAGLRDPDSLVLTPNGILFMSQKGIQLLNRGLQISQRQDGTNWGSPVEAYNGNTIVAAQLIPNTTEVRFTCASGVSLLYDYQYDQWGTNTNLGVDSIVWNGTYYYLEAAGNVREEISNYYLDDSTGFSLVATSPWMKFAGLQGFQRIWKFFLQGFFPGTNPIQVQIAYDYNPTIVDTFVLNAGASAGGSGTHEFAGQNSHTTYTVDLGSSVTPGTLQLILLIFGDPVIGTDNGSGGITGSGIVGTGTINYSTGVCVFEGANDYYDENLQFDYDYPGTSYPDLPRSASTTHGRSVRRCSSRSRCLARSTRRKLWR